MSATSAKRRLTNAVKLALRDLRSHLAQLNHQVGSQLAIKDVDLECLDIVARHGPLSPKALALRAGLHPATLTGVLDRLEREGWIARDRDPADRRGVLLNASRERGAEILRRYGGMNSALDHICAGYTEAELKVIADFLQRAASAGASAAEELSKPSS